MQKFMFKVPSFAQSPPPQYLRFLWAFLWVSTSHCVVCQKGDVVLSCLGSTRGCLGFFGVCNIRLGFVDI